MLIVLFRTIILYLLVVVSMRLMGKKQIGEMEPFELAVAIMISELASLPMQDTRISLTHGIIPIITLLTLQTLLALLQLKSEKTRLVFSGKPSILINKGKLDLKKMKDEKFNINNLMEELRMQGYYNLSDVEYAILETSGQLSVIPKTELSPATKQDLKIKPPQENLPITLVLDGKINFKNMIVAKKDETWLKQMMKKNSVPSIDEVLVAMLDSKGKFYCQLKEKNQQ